MVLVVELCASIYLIAAFCILGEEEEGSHDESEESSDIWEGGVKFGILPGDLNIRAGPSDKKLCQGVTIMLKANKLPKLIGIPPLINSFIFKGPNTIISCDLILRDK